jgi:protein disulfide-isomerase A6
LGSRFEVHGYPTLKWFPKGSTTPEEYSGGRDLDALISFVTEKSGMFISLYLSFYHRPLRSLLPLHATCPSSFPYTCVLICTHSFAGARSKAKKSTSNVVVLDSANFDKIVLDSSKDVLVEFYAPVSTKRDESREKGGGWPAAV